MKLLTLRVHRPSYMSALPPPPSCVLGLPVRNPLIAAAVSALTARVDYGISPKRFTRSWEEVSTNRSMGIADAAMALGLADLRQSMREFPEAMDLARRIGEPALLVQAYHFAGVTTFHLGAFQTARDWLQRSLEALRLKIGHLKWGCSPGRNQRQSLEADLARLRDRHAAAADPILQMKVASNNSSFSRAVRI